MVLIPRNLSTSPLEPNVFGVCVCVLKKKKSERSGEYGGCGKVSNPKPINLAVSYGQQYSWALSWSKIMTKLEPMQQQQNKNK